MARYRRRQWALAGAAAAAEAAVFPDEIEAVLARPDLRQEFAGVLDVAEAAQEEWWHRVLARVDASVDDDLGVMAPDARCAAARGAWAAQHEATPGYLVLATLGAGDASHESRERRYAQLLARYAGTASAADDDERAADAGLDLVGELADWHTLVASYG
jgi:hypothetical protein